MVEIAVVQVAVELFVAWEPAVGGQHEEVRSNALDVAVLLERLAEGGEGLVQRISGDGADSAAEHIGLDQPDRGREVIGLKRSVRVVVVQLEQEWVGDIDLQLAQVLEDSAERRILLTSQRQRAEVAGEGADVPHQRLDASLLYWRGTGVVLERLIDLALARDIAGLHGQVVAHEAIELGAIGLLPEVLLHRPPVLFVEA